MCIAVVAQLRLAFQWRETTRSDKNRFSTHHCPHHLAPISNNFSAQLTEMPVVVTARHRGRQCGAENVVRTEHTCTLLRLSIPVPEHEEVPQQSTKGERRHTNTSAHALHVRPTLTFVFHVLRVAPEGSS